MPAVQPLAHDVIHRIISAALPDECDWIGNQTLADLVALVSDGRDATRALQNVQGGSNLGVGEAAKLVAAAIALLRWIHDWLDLGGERKMAYEIFAEFSNGQLPAHVLEILPDRTKRELFSLYMEERSLTNGTKG